jgi:hypothetical protein
MQRQQVGALACDNGVGATVLVAELNENARPAERLDHGSDLPTRQSIFRPIGQQRDDNPGACEKSRANLIQQPATGLRPYSMHTSFGRALAARRVL